MNSSAQLSAAQHLASSGAGVSTLAEKRAGEDNEDNEDIPQLEAAVEDEGPVDETGVDAKDIDLVVQQVGCSRAKAVRVLKQSGGDLINASACPVQCFSHEFLPRAMCSHGRQRVKTLNRCVHCPKYDLPPPPTDFDVIIRPLPSALHNLDSLISGDVRFIPDFQAQLFCRSYR